jgi:large subunit ribosomal protein L16
MKIPKRTKYKKYHRLNKNLYKSSFRKLQLSNGFWGLKALEGGKISEKQIESFRQTINKQIKPLGTLWIRIFPYLPVTAKPLEVRMGKGKGSVKRWVYNARPGQILYEIGGVSAPVAVRALTSGLKKLPIKTKVVSY